MESLWGKGRGLEFGVEPFVPPVNTIPHAGQIDSLLEKGRGLGFSVEPSIPPVNTVPRGDMMENV